MDELYVFGYGYNKQFPSSLRPGDDPVQRPEHLDVKTVSTPTRTLHAESIEILWASWCDLILKINNTTLHYHGTSLIQPQISAIETLTHQPIFFGRRSTSGVLGYLLPSHHSITLFHTPEQLSAGADPVSTYSFTEHPWTILDLHFTANESVLVSIKCRTAEAAREGAVIEVPSLAYLEEFLSRREQTLESFGVQHVRFAPTQCCTNISTLTALDANGKVHTYATDRRFPSALGRDSFCLAEEGDIAQPIPFLEETIVKKIAAGALYTAAVSEDGELHLWGQATTDMPGELRAVRDREEGGDEYVRTPEMRIDGHIARVIDVAVGFGCVLVAAECEGQNGSVEREVFAAGNNRRGCLGLGPDMDKADFVDEFLPLSLLNGRKIKQILCAGMSSYVVAEAGVEG